ncbi:MAG: TIGR02530 family flagellar biosynthesis protein [Anaerolineales bacterium]
MNDSIRITNNNLNSQNPSGVKIQKSSTQIDFAEALTQKTEEQAIRFSNHAQKRLQSRAIQLGDDGLARLAQAVEKAEKRGGKESLVLMDDLAFIVNVKQKLVVTAIGSNERGEGVFTQIDSVVLADK